MTRVKVGVAASAASAGLVMLALAAPLEAMVLPEKTEAFEPGGYVAYKLGEDQSIEIDGRLDEPTWAEVEWTEPFVDHMGEHGETPHLETRVKVRWDDEYLYVGAKLEEPDVRATLTERNAFTWRDSNFELFIDPSKDNHDYYEFSLNAKNTVYDIYWDRPFESRRSLYILRNWNLPGVKSAVHIEGRLNDDSEPDGYWSIEIAMPWASLEPLARRTVPPEDGDQWRMDFVRVQQYRDGRRSSNWTWTPQWARNNHLPDRWGYVQFSTAAPGEAAFEPDESIHVRHALQEIFYAHKRHERRHGEWLDTLDELARVQDWVRYEHPSIVKSPTMERTECGFVLTAHRETADGTIERWHMRQDWRIWMESD